MCVHLLTQKQTWWAKEGLFGELMSCTDNQTCKPYSLQQPSYSENATFSSFHAVRILLIIAMTTFTSTNALRAPALGEFSERKAAPICCSSLLPALWGFLWRWRCHACIQQKVITIANVIQYFHSYLEKFDKVKIELLLYLQQRLFIIKYNLTILSWTSPFIPL